MTLKTSDSLLGKNFSKHLKCLFLFFQKKGLDIPCKLSPNLSTDFALGELIMVK